VIPFPDPEDIEKLSKTFLRIYEFFQNPGNNFRNTRRSFRIRKKSEKNEKFISPG
jgi:adenylate cyclase class IV